jgi:hypothetical protein
MLILLYPNDTIKGIVCLLYFLRESNNIFEYSNNSYRSILITFHNMNKLKLIIPVTTVAIISEYRYHTWIMLVR